MRTTLILAWVGLWSVAASADYLDVKRPALLKAEPNPNSETLAQLAVPAKVRIIDAVEQNGYYHVELPSGEQGWVFRMLGRRVAGDLPGDEAIGTLATGSTALTSRVAAAKRKKSQPCVANLAACPDTGCADPETEPEHALLNTLKHDANPTGTLTPLTFKQFKQLQSKTNALHLPVGFGTELSADDRKKIQRFDLPGGVTIGEGGFVQLIGFIAPDRTLRASGGESVNCRLTDAPSNDIHIPIVEASDDTEFDSIVVEPIPQSRPAAWTVARFRKLQEDGRLLMLRGHLLFDNQHRVHDDPEDTSSEPKRFTTWELHPVTQLFECTRTANDCSPTNQTQWREIK